MILMIVFFILGVMVGMNLRHESTLRKYQATFEEVDEQVRKDLEYYKNLSKSLQQDLDWCKHKQKSTN
jgi:uncharacterized membrane protein